MKEGFDSPRDRQMKYHVYILLTNYKQRFYTYVGYSKNIKKRLNLHNSGKGAKFTRGKKWKLVYYEKYDSKSEAMKNEFRLKKNYNLRNKIIKNK